MRRESVATPADHSGWTRAELCARLEGQETGGPGARWPGASVPIRVVAAAQRAHRTVDTIAPSAPAPRRDPHPPVRARTRRSAPAPASVSTPAPHPVRARTRRSVPAPAGPHPRRAPSAPGIAMPVRMPALVLVGLTLRHVSDPRPTPPRFTRPGVGTSHPTVLSDRPECRDRVGGNEPDPGDRTVRLA